MFLLRVSFSFLFYYITYYIINPPHPDPTVRGPQVCVGGGEKRTTFISSWKGGWGGNSLRPTDRTHHATSTTTAHNLVYNLFKFFLIISYSNEKQIFQAPYQRFEQKHATFHRPFLCSTRQLLQSSCLEFRKQASF